MTQLILITVFVGGIIAFPPDHKGLIIAFPNWRKFFLFFEISEIYYFFLFSVAGPDAHKFFGENLNFWQNFEFLSEIYFF